MLYHFFQSEKKGYLFSLCFFLAPLLLRFSSLCASHTNHYTEQGLWAFARTEKENVIKRALKLFYAGFSHQAGLGKILEQHFITHRSFIIRDLLQASCLPALLGSDQDPFGCLMTVKKYTLQAVCTGDTSSIDIYQVSNNSYYYTGALENLNFNDCVTRSYEIKPVTFLTERVQQSWYFKRRSSESEEIYLLADHTTFVFMQSGTMSSDDKKKIQRKCMQDFFCMTHHTKQPLDKIINKISAALFNQSRDLHTNIAVVIIDNNREIS